MDISKLDFSRYQSPVELVATEMRLEMEDQIVRAVQEVGVNVDKDELIKALNYDRHQYLVGLLAGYDARDCEIVRCRECVYGDRCAKQLWIQEPDGFCSKGERMEE